MFDRSSLKTPRDVERPLSSDFLRTDGCYDDFGKGAKKSGSKCQSEMEGVKIVKRSLVVIEKIKSPANG